MELKPKTQNMLFTKYALPQEDISPQSCVFEHSTYKQPQCNRIKTDNNKSAAPLKYPLAQLMPSPLEPAPAHCLMPSGVVQEEKK
eukprot:1554468-Amphidinium_carterae.1